MANRIVGNVLILDSGMGNFYALATDSNETTVRLKRVNVNSIVMVQSGGAGLMRLSLGADTTNVIAELNSSNKMTFFASPVTLNDLKVPTLTNASGFVYFV